MVSDIVSYARCLHRSTDMQFIKEKTDERLSLGAGTLYGALNKLEEKGWIALYGDKESRKKYFITEFGRNIVQKEILPKKNWQDYENQKPRCKQRGIKLATLQSSGVFDPRGIRQHAQANLWLALQARHLTHCSRE